MKSEQPGISTAALVHNKIADPVALLNRLNADALHVSQHAATREVIEEIKANGFFVNVYTVNDEQSIQHFKAAGADGIITDFPQRCTRLEYSTGYS